MLSRAQHDGLIGVAFFRHPESVAQAPTLDKIRDIVNNIYIGGSPRRLAKDVEDFT